ncbi:MAG: hypothetical protein ACYCZR_06890 [Burkholderiales bacterium]
MKRPQEAVRGAYSALPHGVMDSPAYTGASIAAKALLNELIRQHNGTNNGRLHLVHTWLSKRGWASKSIVEKARDELLARGLIIQTKQGGLFVGPSWHALTWLPITNHVGLEVSPSTYHPGGWQLCGLPPTERRKPPSKNREAQPDHRGSTGPTTGAASNGADPTTGAIRLGLGQITDPTTGDDVLHHSLSAEIVVPEWCLGSWRWVGNQARASHCAPGGRFSLYRRQGVLT